MRASNRKPIFLSVVAPAYNEIEILKEFHARLTNALNEIDCDGYEVLYINDGSSDGTLNLLEEIRGSDNHVSIIDLSRNFGKELALTAGLDYSKGDAVVVIDTDLQDPPELIHEFVKKYNEGYEVVYGKRITREGDSRLKKLTAYLFYRIIQKVTYLNIPQDTGDFRLLSRRAVDELNKLRERHRFMKGMFAWIGFSQIEVLYHRDRRFAGETKWNYWNLWNFAIEGLTSFTTKPLKLTSYVGILVAASSLIYAGIIIVKTLLFGDPTSGYPSLMVVILFLGSIQLIALGVIGEYLARTFNEVKDRPLYIVQQYSPAISLSSRDDPAQNEVVD